MCIQWSVIVTCRERRHRKEDTSRIRRKWPNIASIFSPCVKASWWYCDTHETSDSVSSVVLSVSVSWSLVVVTCITEEGWWYGNGLWFMIIVITYGKSWVKIICTVLQLLQYNQWHVECFKNVLEIIDRSLFNLSCAHFADFNRLDKHAESKWRHRVEWCPQS